MMESWTVHPGPGVAVCGELPSDVPHQKAMSWAGPVVVTLPLVVGEPVVSLWAKSLTSPPFFISRAKSVISSSSGKAADTVCPLPPLTRTSTHSAVPQVGQSLYGCVVPTWV